METDLVNWNVRSLTNTELWSLGTVEFEYDVESFFELYLKLCGERIFLYIQIHSSFN